MLEEEEDSSFENSSSGSLEDSDWRELSCGGYRKMVWRTALCVGYSGRGVGGVHGTRREQEQG